MSFSSFNAVRAAGGMQGTTRAARPTAEAWQPAGATRVPSDVPLPVPGGIQPLSPQAAIRSPYGPQNAGGGSGMMASRSHGGAAQYINQGQTLGGGVMPGAPAPQLQGPAPVKFDPNDPNNAALAGYMNG